ncbi:MAG TPA: hypothetical protein VMH04_06230 [Candidatus Solibacter sp.]|nr:hypothetical protein [Candidatus Solibacter sp.]
MQLNAFGKVGNLDPIKSFGSTVQDAATKQAQEVLAQINLLLKLLQSAGYSVGNFDFELGLPPKVTIKLKTGTLVNEEKLAEIVGENSDKSAIVAIVTALMQANKLRTQVTVDSLKMEDVEIVLATTPTITLQWTDRAGSDI